MSGLPRDVQGNFIRPGDRIAVATNNGPGGGLELVIRCVERVQGHFLLLHRLPMEASYLSDEDAARRALRLS